MTVCLDTSALVKRYRQEEHSEWVDLVMTEDQDWCASALIATESAIALSRDPALRAELTGIEGRLSTDLASFVMVPVDASCLVRALEIGMYLGLRTLDAIHLAASDALPSQTSFVTFDRQQREAANALGLKVLTPPV